MNFSKFIGVIDRRFLLGHIIILYLASCLLHTYRKVINNDNILEN